MACAGCAQFEGKLESCGLGTHLKFADAVFCFVLPYWDCLDAKFIFQIFMTYGRFFPDSLIIECHIHNRDVSSPVHLNSNNFPKGSIGEAITRVQVVSQHYFAPYFKPESFLKSAVLDVACLLYKWSVFLQYAVPNYGFDGVLDAIKSSHDFRIFLISCLVRTEDEHTAIHNGWVVSMKYTFL